MRFSRFHWLWLAVLLCGAAFWTWYDTPRTKPAAVASEAVATPAAATAHAANVAVGKVNGQLPQGAAGTVEARLIDTYRLIAQGNTREALKLAEKLVADHPNFQLAQLVYGDLLMAQTGPVGAFGNAPADLQKQAPGALDDLRAESLARIRALQTPPPANSVPVNFLGLGKENEHALAVDASQSRMYLFQNTAQGFKLIADYYISVGKAGTSKTAEGDLRTPLGAYFVSNKLDPAGLKDLYGSGAFPINYPNPFDLRRGKGGSGIWLHGTPSAQYSRPPLASDGCVVLSNSDLLSLGKKISVRTTPVVIAQHLQWVDHQSQPGEPWQSVRSAWERWRTHLQAGQVDAALAFYAPDFDVYGRKLPEFTQQLREDIAKNDGKGPAIDTPSWLYWTEPNGSQLMIATYDQKASSSAKAKTYVNRQYWLRSKAGEPWKIIFQALLWPR